MSEGTPDKCSCKAEICDLILHQFWDGTSRLACKIHKTDKLHHTCGTLAGEPCVNVFSQADTDALIEAIQEEVEDEDKDAKIRSLEAKVEKLDESARGLIIGMENIASFNPKLAALNWARDYAAAVVSDVSCNKEIVARHLSVNRIEVLQERAEKAEAKVEQWQSNYQEQQDFWNEALVRLEKAEGISRQLLEYLTYDYRCKVCECDLPSSQWPIVEGHSDQCFIGKLNDPPSAPSEGYWVKGKVFLEMKQRAEKAEKERDDLKAQLEEKSDYECEVCETALGVDDGVICQNCWTNDARENGVKVLSRRNEKIVDLQAQLARVVEVVKLARAEFGGCGSTAEVDETAARMMDEFDNTLSSTPEPGQVLVDEDRYNKLREATRKWEEISDGIPDPATVLETFLETEKLAEALKSENDQLREVVRQGFGVVDGLVRTHKQKQWVEIANKALGPKP